MKNTLNDTTGFLYNFGVPIQGFEAVATPNTWSPALHSAIPAPIGGTDVLSIRTTARRNFPITQHADKTADIQTVANTTLQQNDIAVVSGCQASAVFQITQISTGATRIPHGAGSG